MQRSTRFFLVAYRYCIHYFSKTKRKPAKKVTGQCCSTEMEVACENSANLEQETKATKIVTYPLFPLASSYIFGLYQSAGFEGNKIVVTSLEAMVINSLVSSVFSE